jgi:glutathione S-transferase
MVPLDPRHATRVVGGNARSEEISMPVEYVEFEAARNREGLRMVVVPGVPSPWGEAAKGILHVKQIPYGAVKLDQGNDAMAEWTGTRSGPVAIYDNEAPRSGWAEILLLAERLSEKPRLLPSSPAERALAFGLSHEICGEMGLGWCRRLQGVHAGLSGGGGFPPPVAAYLAPKYGYHAEQADEYTARVVALLGMLASYLRAQHDAGNSYILGESLSAVDIYSATFMALIDPLPSEQCPMPDAMRAAFGTKDEATEKAADPILIEHRDFVYENHLELPLSI